MHPIDESVTFHGGGSALYYRLESALCSSSSSSPRSLLPAALDAGASVTAQTLADTILDSSNGDDNEVTSAAAEFLKAGHFHTAATVALTGTFRLPRSLNGHSSDGSSDALERSVLDSAVALLTVAADAPELLSVFMSPSATHFALGVAAHGEGRVRVVACAIRRLAGLVGNDGPIIHTVLPAEDGEAEEGGNDGDDLVNGAPSSVAIAGKLLATTLTSLAPGWSIVGAEVLAEADGGESGEEDAFR